MDDDLIGFIQMMTQATGEKPHEVTWVKEIISRVVTETVEERKMIERAETLMEMERRRVEEQKRQEIAQKTAEQKELEQLLGFGLF